jgi:hypothetical protein
MLNCWKVLKKIVKLLRKIKKNSKFVNMNKKEKLSLVFDFISDYLTNEDNVNEDNVNDTEVEVNKRRTLFEDTMGRAHDIMKKMDDIDKTDAKVKTAVNNATKPLKEAINKVKTLFNEEIKLDKKTEEIKDLSEKFTQKTGVTLDNEGKVVEVKVGPLKEYTTISEVMDDIGPSLNEIRDQDMVKLMAKSKKVKN